MSATFPGSASRRPRRRVREEARDGIAVMVFSAVASSAFALTLMLLVRLAG